MKIIDRRLFKSIVKDLKKEVCGEKAWFWLCFSI